MKNFIFQKKNFSNSCKYEIELLIRGLEELKINQSSAIGRFQIYLETLFEYRNKIHLISHKDYERITLRHFLPSLVALPFIGEAKTACDIGAGAGFPSIPIKIIRPEIKLTLFESQRKKARFLKVLIERLNLSNICVIDKRAENYEGDGFDLVLIKAAGKIKDLIDTFNLLLNPSGRVIFYKSPMVDEEVSQAKEKILKFGFLPRIELVTTPIEKRKMALVILTK
uniref:Ribosomal RNA small subunit methyltransferase G n=1 Tax=candidate division WOR-3 bacterium TaxID=2052148 RepID=A0A7C4TCQ1_UNCW3